MRGDSATLSSLGTLGGRRSGQTRRATAQSDARLKALEAGTIAPPKKRRPTITMRRLLALQDWFKNPENRARCEEECCLRDTAGHFDICPVD